MLNLILGRNYCNKTEYVRQLVADRVNAGEDGFIIIVPEQFSFDTEKGMLEKVGASGMQRLEVLSLSRLAELILEETGKKSDKQSVDKGVKMLTMSLALEALSDKLEIYRRYASRPALIDSMVSLATELKQCSVSVDELEAFAEKSEQTSLKNKLEELTLIITAYNAMLDKSYYNNDDSLTLLKDVLCEYRYFENKTVVFDEFTRFTKQEMDVVEKIISQSKDVYFTFNTDFEIKTGNSPQFENVNAQIEKIKNVAENCRVEIAEPVILKDEADGIDGELSLLEKNMFSYVKQPYEGCPKAVKIYAADNKADECNFVALSIKRLLRENKARCRDIIVYQREKGGYDSCLVSAFRRYGVPFFEDRRQPVEMSPLMVYVSSLLDIICRGITTESLMRYLKTGLTSLGDDEISELENYAFTWNIKTSQWKNKFTDNPQGYGKKLNDFDKEKLKKLNAYREKAVGPLLEFKADFSAASGEEKATVLFDFLKKNNVALKLKQRSDILAGGDTLALFEQQDAVWTILMGMLDRLYLACKQENVSDKRFLELFNILLSVSDLGTLPQGLDDVTLALADRTRAGLKKYVFAVGVNDGVFPKTPSSEGLLNDNERIELRNAGIELAETAQYKGVEEQYIAYNAVCSATDGLYVSYSKSDYNGTALSESEIISEIKAAFPDIEVGTSDGIPEIDRIESRDSAFEEFAHNYNSESAFSASLEEYFDNDPIYSGRINTLKNAAQKKEKVISDKSVAIDLFGRDLYMSYSRIDEYRRCPFRYFCRFGMDAQPREEARISSSLNGTIIHKVFEVLLGKYSKEELENISDDDLKAEINNALDDYLTVYMGGAQNKTERLLSQYRAIADELLSVFKRVCEEFRLCDFEPVEFEFEIGGSGRVRAYEIKLDDGGTLIINGNIDRIDTYENENGKYLRIIDYKAKGKEFKLNEVLSGFNLQMLIYLFALYVNGKKEFGDFIPGGILYMSGSASSADLGRDADEQDILEKQLHDKDKKMSGLLLNDRDVLEAMENGLNGYFIPVSLKKGKLEGDCVSLKALLKLKEKVDAILKQTAENLHEGIISVLPAPKACDFCKYKAVCGFEDGDPVLEIAAMKNPEIISMLEETEEETDGED